MAGTITIRIKQELYEAVKQRAVADGVTVSEWVRRAVDAYLDMDLVEKQADFERRLARLEEVAGL